MELQVTLKKFDDRPSVLSIQREDGSETWQSYGNQSEFFPLHDLTHYAVESELGLTRAFFGMIANGRDANDFGPGDAANMDTEAHFAEILVGLIMSSDTTDTYLTNDEILSLVRDELARLGLAPIRIEPGQLSDIRSLRDSLVAFWRMLPPGQMMTLDFPPDLSL